MTKQHWITLRTTLRVLGFSGFLSAFVSLLGLTVYYSYSRPDVPQSQTGYTERLSWTHPTRYGTAKDERLLSGLFISCFPFFFLIGVGEAMRLNKY
jgi:hypothetical protein